MDTDEDDLINIANTIYTLLRQEKEIKSEEELFSDKIYLEIISILLPNIQGEITPGKTPEEKIETIELLLSLLDKLLEANLDIDPKKIILEHDKESAKNFLEILLEVTTSLLNSGAEFEEDEDDFEEKKMNISDPRIKYNNEESVESLRLGKDKKKEKSEKKSSNKKKKEEKNDLNIFDKEKSQSGENLIYDKDNIDLDIDNINEEKKNNSEIDDEIIRKNTDEENINITNDNNEIINSEKKTYDIPGLLQDDLEKSKSNKISNNSNNKSKSNMEIDNENELEEEEYNIRKNKYDFGNLNNSEDDNSSINNKLANSVPQPMDKPMLTNNNSSEDYIDLRKNQKSKEKKDDDDFDYNYNDELDEKNNSNSNSNTSNMNISLHSKKTKSKQKLINESNNSNKKIENSTSNKKTKSNKNKITNNNNTGTNSKNQNTNKISNKKSRTSTKKNNLSESQTHNNISSNNDDISKSSIYTNSLRPAPNPNEKNKNLEQNSRKSSIKTKSKSSASTIINSEIPLDTQGFKFELVKELKKLYGKKIGKVLQGPNNSYSNLDLVLQEFKLAKKQEKLLKKAMKSQNTTKNNNNVDKNSNISSEESILTKDFLLKNERLLQLMLQICDKKLKNKKAEQEKKVREIGLNLNFMRKLKDFENKRLENEIANKKFFYKNNNNFLEEKYFCQKIYNNYYQLEAEKLAREIESMRIINAMKLEEKTNNINDIENYYRNKIAILNEIGRREREENMKNKMEEDLFYYQLNSMPKKELKKTMKMMINSLEDDIFVTNDDEENNNIQNNQEELEKILDNYYKK